MVKASGMGNVDDSQSSKGMFDPMYNSGNNNYLHQLQMQNLSSPQSQPSVNLQLA